MDSRGNSIGERDSGTDSNKANLNLLDGAADADSKGIQNLSLYSDVQKETSKHMDDYDPASGVEESTKEGNTPQLSNTISDALVSRHTKSLLEFGNGLSQSCFTSYNKDVHMVDEKKLASSTCLTMSLGLYNSKGAEADCNGLSILNLQGMFGSPYEPYNEAERNPLKFSGMNPIRAKPRQLLPKQPQMHQQSCLEASKTPQLPSLSRPDTPKEPAPVPIRVARPPVEGRGRNQLLPRYWPRITDQELQQITAGEYPPFSNSTITPLFEKMLSASDAGRIGRLVLPKACAEAYFPPISQPEGLPLKIQDVSGKDWVFQFRFWPNNNSRMYVLEGVTPCIQSMQLQAGDTVTFSRLDPEGKLVMGYRRAPSSLSSQVDSPIQRGFRRRCLDFRVSDSRRMSKSPPLLNSISGSGSHIKSPYSPDSSMHVTSVREHSLAMSADAARNSDSSDLSQCYLLRKSNCVPPEIACQSCPPCETFSNSPTVPCGIGLHLNSLTGRIPLFQSSRGEIGDAGYLTSMKRASEDVGATPPSRMQSAYQPGEVLSLPSSAGFGTRLQSGPIFEDFENSIQQGLNIEEQLVISLLEEMEMDLCKEYSINVHESVAHVGSRNSQQNEYEPYGIVEETSSPIDQEMVSLPQMDVDGGQDGSSLSGKKARKRASIADSSEIGCKRCNCKKSKCLKLYCECFAAGLFCVDNCSCQDCHNTPSFEETVLETRQQIESRNPPAFAPRVVQALTESPSGEKTFDFTPSARHEKGCSCKKSKCLKKYCECYQAGVGCSEGCRCEDCQNLYGKKKGWTPKASLLWVIAELQVL